MTSRLLLIFRQYNAHSYASTMTTKLYFQLFALYHECAFDIIFTKLLEIFGSDHQISF